MSRCYIIAEVGLSHCGDIGTAIKAVNRFALAGADAVKFQDHRWQVLDPEQPHPSPHVNMTRQVWYEQTAFDDVEWSALRTCCELAGVDYICSPFSVEALREQVKLEPRYIKIASGEVTNGELIGELWSHDVEVLYSTGMGVWSRALLLGPARQMICTSEYPCAPEHSMLMVAEPGSAFSDHTTGTWFPVAAVALGATMIEKHVALTDCAHSDRDIALTPAKFAEMVEGIRAVEKALYEPSEPDLTEIRRVYLHAP